MTLEAGKEIVKSGCFTYAGQITCDVRIIRSTVQYGSGDHEDSPHLEYGSTTARGEYNAGGGPYDSLAEAIAAAEAAPGIGDSMR